MKRTSLDIHEIAASTFRAGLNEIEAARNFARIPHFGATLMWGAFAIRSLQWAVCYANGISDLEERYPYRRPPSSPSTPTPTPTRGGSPLTG